MEQDSSYLGQLLVETTEGSLSPSRVNCAAAQLQTEPHPTWSWDCLAACSPCALLVFKLPAGVPGLGGDDPQGCTGVCRQLVKTQERMLVPDSSRWLAKLELFSPHPFWIGPQFWERLL